MDISQEDKQNSELRRENTLTTPSDRNREVKFKLDSNAPPLTDEQTNLAMSELNITSYVERFPQVERRYADPPISLQKIGLVSFVPAKGATPNKEGIYGFAKLRGNFDTGIEADERAEFIVRNIDSYHKIFHTYVGRPFPLTVLSDYTENVQEIDLQKEITSAIGDDIKKKRQKEQQDMEDIKKREQELLSDVKKEEEDIDDRYTTLRVKKAQLVWTYVETEKKMKQMCGLIAKARKEREELDEKQPELKEKYYNKYMQARRDAQFPEDKIKDDESFMKYLVEDLKIPAVNEEYKRLYE
jgi:hypothetical protein